MINTNNLAGFVYKKYLKAAKNRSNSASLWNKIRGSIIKRQGNPVIEVPYLNRNVLMHLSSSIIESYELFPYFDRALPKIAKHLNSRMGYLHFLDIGGNVGFTVFNVKDEVPNAVIVTVEGAKYYLEILEHNLSSYSDVSILPVFLGESENESLNLSISSNATARISTLTTNQIASEVVSTTSLDSLIEQFKNQSFNCNFVKIDVDGYELFILKGGLKYLSINKPALFLEWTPRFIKAHNQNPFELASLLLSVGYDSFVFFKNTGEFISSYYKPNLEQMLVEMDKKLTEESYYYDIACFSSSKLEESNIEFSEITKMFSK